MSAERLAAIHDRIGQVAQLPQGWDSYGAPAIAPELVAAAWSYAASLAERLAMVPKVAPLTTGTLQFEYRAGSRLLELELRRPNAIAYLCWSPTEGIEEEGEFALDDLAETQRLIDWITRGQPGAGAG